MVLLDSGGELRPNGSGVWTRCGARVVHRIEGDFAITRRESPRALRRHNHPGPPSATERAQYRPLGWTVKKNRPRRWGIFPKAPSPIDIAPDIAPRCWRARADLHPARAYDGRPHSVRRAVT